MDDISDISTQGRSEWLQYLCSHMSFFLCSALDRSASIFHFWHRTTHSWRSSRLYSEMIADQIHCKHEDWSDSKTWILNSCSRNPDCDETHHLVSPALDDLRDVSRPWAIAYRPSQLNPLIRWWSSSVGRYSVSSFLDEFIVSHCYVLRHRDPNSKSVRMWAKHFCRRDFADFKRHTYFAVFHPAFPVIDHYVTSGDIFFLILIPIISYRFQSSYSFEAFLHDFHNSFCSLICHLISILIVFSVHVLHVVVDFLNWTHHAFFHTIFLSCVFHQIWRWIWQHRVVNILAQYPFNPRTNSISSEQKHILNIFDIHPLILSKPCWPLLISQSQTAKVCVVP